MYIMHRGSFGPPGKPALQYHMEPLHHHLGSTNVSCTYVQCTALSCILLLCVVHGCMVQVEMLCLEVCWLEYVIRPSQLSCLSSSVGRGVQVLLKATHLSSKYDCLDRVVFCIASRTWLEYLYTMHVVIAQYVSSTVWRPIKIFLSNTAHTFIYIDSYWNHRVL